MLKLDLGRMKQCVSLVGHFRLIRRELENLYPVEGPAMRRSNLLELRFSFRQGHKKATLAIPDSLHEELDCEGRLTGARLSVDQIYMVAREAPVQNLVEPRDAGSYEGQPHGLFIRLGHRCILASVWFWQ